MNLPQLTDSARLRRVQLEALIAQQMAGGTLEDWQLHRLVDPAAADHAAAVERFRLIVSAEAENRRRSRAKARSIPDRRRTAVKRPPKCQTAPGPRF